MTSYGSPAAPFDSEEQAIQAVEASVSRVAPNLLSSFIRPHARFRNARNDPWVIQDYWFVSFDIEEPGTLASTAAMHFCVERATGAIYVVDEDWHLQPISSIRDFP